MKKRFLAAMLAGSVAVISGLGLSACSGGSEATAPKWGSEYTYATAYAQAQELGYAGTLEEFIETISGKDGVNGTNGKDGQAGKDGADGVGVKSATINDKGHLIVTLTDDKEIDCGAVLDVHTHDYGEWITLNEANCTDEGLRLRICQTCSYTEANVIPTAAHTWGNWQLNAEKGNHNRVCSVCKAAEEAPHDMVDGVCTGCGKLEMVTPVQGKVITPFGFYRDVTMGTVQNHNGVDIASDEGTAVVAAFNGTVVNIALGGVLDGSVITVEHVNGVQTKYQFVNPTETLKVGDKVQEGETIGTVMAPCGSEQKLPAHIHFEVVVNGQAVDPADYVDLPDEQQDQNEQQ